MQFLIPKSKNVNFTRNLVNFALGKLPDRFGRNLRFRGVTLSSLVPYSSRGNPGLSGGGSLLRDLQGRFIFGYSCFFGTLSSLQVELKALVNL